MNIEFDAYKVKLNDVRPRLRATARVAPTRKACLAKGKKKK